MGQRQRGLAVRASRVLRLLYPGVTLSSRGVCSEPLSYVSVVYVMAIIASGWYLVVPCTLLRVDLRQWSVFAGFVAVVFHGCMFLTTFPYLLACFADPGAVPESWKPLRSAKGDSQALGTGGTGGGGVVGREAPDASEEAMYDSSSGVGDELGALLLPVVGSGSGMMAPDGVPEAAAAKRHLAVPEVPPAVLSGTPPGEIPRFCRYCRHFKPSRTHHCGACNRCSLHFDHHCAFMRSGCIGFHNRKFFVLFLGYASVSCTMVAIIAPFGVAKFLEETGDSSVGADLTKLMFLMLSYMLCALHAIVLAGFCGYHVYLICRNLTTLEHSDLTREDCERYNRGLARNWRAVFGVRPMLWFLPVSLGREGDGTRWRFVEDLL